MTTATLRDATLDDAHAIGRLIAGLAHRVLDAGDASAMQAFLATLTPEATAARIASPAFRHVVAEDGSGLCGVIALRDGSHIHHLFVRADLHGRGIARSLWQHVRTASGRPRFTVRSSLSAEPVYARFGFVREAPPQTTNGLTYVPMHYAEA